MAEVLYLGRTRLQTLHRELVTEAPLAVLISKLPEPQFLRLGPTCTVALRHATIIGNTLVVAGRRFAVGTALQDELLARLFQTAYWGA